MADRHDVFISYSRQADERLATLLQQRLQQFAKPVFRRRSLRVFRDDANLSANPGLWSSIEEALDRSDHLLVLASRDAAASEWVGREVDHWRATKPAGSILLALTRGEASWDDQLGGFDPARSNAIPSSLLDAFAEEPRYVDLRWVADQSVLNKKDPRLADAVADLAAPLHGRPKDDLVGEDLHQHRRLLRLTWFAAAMLVTLAAGAVVAAIAAIDQRNAAERQTVIAQVRELSARSLASADPFEALALGVQAELTSEEPRTEARDAYARAVQRVGVLPLLPDGPAIDTHAATGTAVDFSADGRWLASGGANATLEVWDVESREQVASLGVDASVRLISFSPTTDWMVVGDAAGSLWIWRPDTDPSEAGRVHLGDTSLAAAAWSPDGARIAVGGVDGRVWVVDVADGSTLGAARELETTSTILAVAWVEDRIAYIAQELVGGTIDPSTGQPLSEFQLQPHGDLHEAVVIEAGFSPDGTQVATIADNGSPYLWRTMTGEPIGGPFATAFGPIAWAPDGRTFLSGSADLRVHDADQPSADPFPSVPVHQGLVTASSWSPDGATVVTIDDGGTLRYWRARTGRDPLAYLYPRSIRWSDGGIVGLEGGLHRWDVRGGPPVTDASVPDGELSPDGTTIAVKNGSTIALYDIARRGSGPPAQAAPNGFVWDVAWSPDGTRIATQAQHDGTRVQRGGRDHARVWAVEADGTLTETASLPTEDRHLSMLGWTPDGQSLLLADANGMSTWDVESEPVHVLDVNGMISEVTFEPGGAHAAIRVDDTVRVVDVSTWSWSDTALPGGAVAWSPDGTLLAVASDGLQLYDVETARPIGTPVPLSEWGISTLAWSPDGFRIAAAGGLDPEVLQILEAWSENDSCELVIDVMGARAADTLIGDGRTSVCAEQPWDVEPPLPVDLTTYSTSG